MRIPFVTKIMTAVVAAILCVHPSVWAINTVQLEEAGTLPSVFSAGEREVKILGDLNGTDIRYLRQLIDNQTVTSLDLSEANIVEGGESYDGDHRTGNDTIGESMFSGCSSLRHVVLPRSADVIMPNAFSRSGLRTIEIPDNVVEVGMDAFAYCYELDTAVVGKRVSSLGQGVFYNSSVKEAYIKSSIVPNITYYLFSSEPNLHVYSEMLGDYEASDWSQFGALVGDLETFFPQEEDPSAVVNAQIGTYFEDGACTVLKPAYASMTDEELAQTMADGGLPDYFVDIALKIKNDRWNVYEKDFRIQDYRAYSDANYWNNLLMSTGGSYMGNPTGIYAGENEPLYVFVDQDIPEDATLYIAGCSGNELISNARSGKKLFKGLNIIDGRKNALYYILYTADTRSKTKKLSEWPTIRIHVEGGVVNGYYDMARHTEDDYVNLLGNASHELFTVKGAETLLNFKTSTYQEVFPTSIDSNVIWFDSLTVWEKELMGICESVATGKRANPPYCLTGGEAIFPIYYNNPNFAIEGQASDDGYANSSPYRTSYNSVGCISATFDVSREDQDDWCAGHECGHNNQGAINLEGCTEVSNNLFSNVICFLDGRTTTKGSPLSTTMNDYVQHTPFFTRNVTSMMRMYYQLYLYYHQAQKNTSFYPTLFQELRNDPLSLWENTDNSSLKFVRKVCEVAQEDLTDFFSAWGFFEPCSLVIDDYGVHTLTVTQEDIDKTLAEISKYPKKNREILFVEDRAQYVLSNGFLIPAGEKRNGSEVVGQYANLGQFSDYLLDSIPLAAYTYRQTDSLFAMSGSGGIGFIMLDDDDNLLYASNTLDFCVPSCIGKNYSIYAMDPDGTLHEACRMSGGVEVVHMSEPGTLSDSLTDQVIKAIVTGPINGTDIAYLRQLVTDGHLQSLDLSGATIVSGGEAYYESYVTEQDVIGEFSFATCAQLVSVQLPTSVTMIKENAFSHTGLNGVTIPDDVTLVGVDAFAYCDKLSEVVIGSGVKRLDQGVFYTSEVKNVYVKATTPPSIGNYLFSSEPVIHVYASALADYEASDWANFGKIVGDLDDINFQELTRLTLPVSDERECGEGTLVYDLFGREVARFQPSVIYVKNGKKMVIVR